MFFAPGTCRILRLSLLEVLVKQDFSSKSKFPPPKKKPSTHTHSLSLSLSLCLSVSLSLFLTGQAGTENGVSEGSGHNLPWFPSVARPDSQRGVSVLNYKKHCPRHHKVQQIPHILFSCLQQSSVPPNLAARDRAAQRRLKQAPE